MLGLLLAGANLAIAPGRARAKARPALASVCAPMLAEGVPLKLPGTGIAAGGVGSLALGGCWCRLRLLALVPPEQQPRPPLPLLEAMAPWRICLAAALNSSWVAFA